MSQIIYIDQRGVVGGVSQTCGFGESAAQKKIHIEKVPKPSRAASFHPPPPLSLSFLSIAYK